MIENYLGNLYGEHIHDGFAGAVFDPAGMSPTVKTVSGGSGQVHIVVKINNKSDPNYSEQYGLQH